MSDKTPTSRAMLERARLSLAGGVSSPFRAKFPVPLYFQDGRGSRLRDVDGNEYIDYTLAWGPLILGHCHPSVVEAVRARAAMPHIYGAEHELEILVAEKIQEMVPCAERVAFTSSGSEAVQLALRLARAFTNRPLILKFEGHYHGWMDSVLLSHHPAPESLPAPGDCRPVVESRGQVSNSADNVLALPWNALQAVEQLFAARGKSIAAVITEPVLCNSGSLMPEEGYLQGLRDVTRRHGALLIFDEIITGFRMHTGGAQAFYGVTPDLATFGKAVGGGLPLSVVAGRRDILEQIAGGGVAFGGTFNGNPLSLAAAQATLGVLAAGGGQLLAAANRRGKRLMERLRESAAAHGIPVTVCGFGAAFSIHFTRRQPLRTYRDTLADDPQRLRRFLSAALEESLYLLPDGRFYISTAHTDEDIELSAQAFHRVLGALT